MIIKLPISTLSISIFFFTSPARLKFHRHQSLNRIFVPSKNNWKIHGLSMLHTVGVIFSPGLMGFDCRCSGFALDRRMALSSHIPRQAFLDHCRKGSPLPLLSVLSPRFIFLTIFTHISDLQFFVNVVLIASLCWKVRHERMSVALSMLFHILEGHDHSE